MRCNASKLMHIEMNEHRDWQYKLTNAQTNCHFHLSVTHWTEHNNKLLFSRPERKKNEMSLNLTSLVWSTGMLQCQLMDRQVKKEESEKLTIRGERLTTIVTGMIWCRSVRGRIRSITSALWIMVWIVSGVVCARRRIRAGLIVRLTIGRWWTFALGKQCVQHTVRSNKVHCHSP